MRASAGRRLIARPLAIASDHGVDFCAAEALSVIVLEVVASFPDATVWVEKRRCDDLSETGPPTQRGRGIVKSCE